MENKKTRTRSKNFSFSEIETLVEEVDKRRASLFGPLKGPKLTQQHRDIAWARVTDAVNAVGGVRRSAAELKSKFKDLKVRTKRKANATKRKGLKTGGGENEEGNTFNALDQKVIQFIGTESIEGIAEGIDTYKLPDEPSTSRQQSSNKNVLLSSPPPGPPSPPPGPLSPPPGPLSPLLHAPSPPPLPSSPSLETQTTNIVPVPIPSIPKPAKSKKKKIKQWP